MVMLLSSYYFQVNYYHINLLEFYHPRIIQIWRSILNKVPNKNSTYITPRTIILDRTCIIKIISV